MYTENVPQVKKYIKSLVPQVLQNKVIPNRSILIHEGPNFKLVRHTLIWTLEE